MIENLHERQIEQRRKIIEIRPENFFELFREGMFLECTKGIPPRAKIISCEMDIRRRVLMIIVECDEFELSEAWKELPVLEVKFNSWFGKELAVIRKLIKSVKYNQEGNIALE